jgi:hypothetical protein
MGVKSETLRPNLPGWNCNKCNIPSSLVLKYNKEKAPKNVDPYRDTYITVYCSPKKVMPGAVRVRARIRREFPIKGSEILENETESDDFLVDITDRCPTKNKKMPSDIYIESLSKL